LYLFLCGADLGHSGGCLGAQRPAVAALVALTLAASATAGAASASATAALVLAGLLNVDLLLLLHEADATSRRVFWRAAVCVARVRCCPARAGSLRLLVLEWGDRVVLAECLGCPCESFLEVVARGLVGVL
jgi:hypothetical protein